jgi:predicted metalloprotease with PDZ domain
MASYYQDVLRGRAGMIPAADAWQHMHASFRRAMQSMPGVTLADATERMYRDGAFMRVYWSGAAIMLLADQRLRTRSNGVQSLDLALARLRECCLSPETGWSALDLFAQLDRLTGTTVFAELYEQHVRSNRFPDLEECYGVLGLRPDPTGERVELVEAAEQRALRDAIMTAQQRVD